jgi:hypothetical protein
MTMRTSIETVIFQHPFRLSGADEVQAAWKHWWAFNATELKLTVLVVGGVALTGLLT